MISEVLTKASHLKEQEVSGNIAQVTLAASESQTVSGQMLDAANGLALQGDVLHQQVDKFLESVRAA